MSFCGWVRSGGAFRKALWAVVVVGVLVTGLPSLAGVAVADPPPSYADVVLGDGPVSYLRLDESSGSSSLFDSATGMSAATGSLYGVLGLPGALPDGEGHAASGSASWSLPSSLVGSARSVEFWIAPDAMGYSVGGGLTLGLWTPELAGSGGSGERCCYVKEAEVHAGVSAGGSEAGDRHGSSDCCGRS